MPATLSVTIVHRLVIVSEILFTARTASPETGMARSQHFAAEARPLFQTPWHGRNRVTPVPDLLNMAYSKLQTLLGR